jgi:hypothetical protein
LINYITPVEKVLGLQAQLFKNGTPVVPQLSYSPDLPLVDFPVPKTAD